MSGTRILIRADAGPAMGTGHAMRCLALAHAAHNAGMDVMLAGRMAVPWLSERLRRENVPFFSMPGNAPSREHPGDLLAQVTEMNPDWVVLDGYHFGPDCQQAVLQAGYKLLVIDDYNHLPEYHCTILLNQNIGAEDYKYLGKTEKKLLGPQFALLRPEFLSARTKANLRTFPDKARKLLLTLGGGDFSEHLFRIAPALAAPELEGCTLRVVAGRMPCEKILDALKKCPAKIEVLPKVDGMQEVMLWADLCITAGGSTCWELCCLGLPFLTIEVAQNQQRIILELERLDLAPRFSNSTLHATLNNPKLRKAYGQKGTQLIDALGTTRATHAMEDISSTAP